MKMNIYEELLNYPNECLDNRKIHKTLIYEAGDLKTRDKNIIQKNIEQITWKYAFRQDNTNIPGFTDDTKEYLEVEIVEILLRTAKKLDRIADIIFRTMPHPSLLFFKYENKVNIYAAHVKIHGSDYSLFTYADEENKMIKTGWINLEKTNEYEQMLFNELKLENLDNANFYKFYDNMYNAIINYKSTILKNGISTLTSNEKKKILQEVNNIEEKIKELQAQIKKDINFNELIELNTLVNEYAQQKQELINKL